MQLIRSLQLAQDNEADRVGNNAFGRGGDETHTGEPVTETELRSSSRIEQPESFNETEMVAFHSPVAGSEIASETDKSRYSFGHLIKQKTI